MESMAIAVNAVTPLTLIILLGVGLRRLGLLNQEVISWIDRINFRVLLPILLFNSLYFADLESDFDLKFIFFTTGIFVAEILSWFVAVPAFEKNKKKQGTLIQAMFRSNTNVFGTAIISQIYNGAGTGLVGVSMLAAVPLPQIFGIVALERCSEEKVSLREMTVNILKNPMIIGLIVSMLTIAARIKLPSAVESTVSSLANAATPMALLTLGGTLELSTVKENERDLAIGILGRAVLHPAIFIPAAVAMSFTGAQLATIMVVTTSPVAVTVFSVTRQMRGDGQLAAQLIVFSTFAAVFSTFACTFILSLMKLI